MKCAIPFVKMTREDRCDTPLSERNRADVYVGMLDSSVYQLVVLPVGVVMVCVQKGGRVGRQGKGRTFDKTFEKGDGGRSSQFGLHGSRSRPAGLREADKWKVSNSYRC